jgi:hypothetical protein
MKYSLIIVFFAVFAFGCQRQDKVTPSTADLKIEINSPQEGQVFKPSDTVFIKANAEYPGELHGYEIAITNTETDSVLYNDERDIHLEHFTIDDQWIGNLAQATALKLSVTVYVDHDGNKKTKEINFSVKP